MALYLHIGFPKTATTSLQQAFQTHADALQGADICYPLIDTDFKQRYLKLFDQKGQARAPDTIAARDAAMAALSAATTAAGCRDVVLSCEELTNFMMMEFAPANLRVLRDALYQIDEDVRIVAYVRNPPDFYLSILQERLKRHGGTLDPTTFQTGFARIIRLYEEVFETTAVVREFHPTRLKDGDIVADFLSACGLDRVDCSAWEQVSTNESLSPEVMLALDLARKELPDTDRPQLGYTFRDSEFLWRRLRRVSGDLDLGRKPVLFSSAFDAVMAANAEDIALMQDRYGIDFAPGRQDRDGAPAVAPAQRISGIEDLMAVERDTALFLSAALMRQMVREIMRQRDKLQSLRAEIAATAETEAAPETAAPDQPA